LKKGDDGCAWFLLALAQGERSDKESAKTWFKRGAAWTKQHAPADTEMHQLWSEAAALLGMPGPDAAGPE
jgi:hypothetical protein